jgi:hypothetical protein
MALVNITLTNDAWWTVIDALKAFSPPDEPLATVIESNVPERGIDSDSTTEIMGLTDQSQESMQGRLMWTPPPLFNAKVVASLIQQQIIAQSV